MNQLNKFFRLKSAAGTIPNGIRHPVTDMPGAMTADLKRLGYGVGLSKLNDPDNIIAFNRVDNLPASKQPASVKDPYGTLKLFFDDSGHVMPKGHMGKLIGGGAGAALGAGGALYLYRLLNKLDEPKKLRGYKKDDTAYQKFFGGTGSALRTLRNISLLGLPIAGGIIGAKLGGNFDNPRGIPAVYEPVYAPGTGTKPTLSTKLQRFTRGLW